MVKSTFYDSHPKLPLDPDSERFQIDPPFHTDGAHVAIVFLGAFFGTLARYEIGLWIPTAKNGFPFVTLCINVSGAFMLGLLVQALLHHGNDAGYRRILRLTLGTGFLGAFTTYSSLAASVALLARNGKVSTACSYAVVSVVLGIVASSFGIWLVSTHHKMRKSAA